MLSTNLYCYVLYDIILIYAVIANVVVDPIVFFILKYPGITLIFMKQVLESFVFVIDGNAIFYETHNFIVVNQFVDSAELEDHQGSDHLHCCLRLESCIVVLCEAKVKQLHHEGSRQDTRNSFRTLQLIESTRLIRDYYVKCK